MGDKNYIFKKTHEMDKDKFAELLISAKGARSMKEFSDVCGVSPSTFTRIIHKRNKGSSSTELLEAIAKNATKDSGVTVEILADANGYTVESDADGTAKSFARNGPNLELLVRSVLVQELLDRNAEVRMGNIKYDFSKSMALSPDALIMTNAFGKKDEVWFVECINFAKKSKSRDLNKSNVKRMVFDRLSRFVFISMNKVELFRPTRYSLVVLNKEVFNLIINEFSETIVPTFISIILIDTLNSRISNEFVLPQNNGQTQESYFMTKSLSENEDIDYLISSDESIENL